MTPVPQAEPLHQPAAAPGCTCPLVVGQPLPQTCPHCRQMSRHFHEASQRTRARRKAARDLRRFLRLLSRCVWGRR